MSQHQKQYDKLKRQFKKTQQAKEGVGESLGPLQTLKKDLTKQTKQQEEGIVVVLGGDSVDVGVAAGVEAVVGVAHVEPEVGVEKTRRNGFLSPNLDALLKMAKSKA